MYPSYVADTVRVCSPAGRFHSAVSVERSIPLLVTSSVTSSLLSIFYFKVTPLFEKANVNNPLSAVPYTILSRSFCVGSLVI